MPTLRIALCLVLFSTAALAHDGANPSDTSSQEIQWDLVGMVQTQMAPWVGSDNLIQDGDGAEQVGFRLRRARLGAVGTAWNLMRFAVSSEATEEGMSVLDAWVGYRQGKTLGFTLGAKKVPFSRFELMGAGKGALIGRPMGSHAMAPGRQVGLTLEGQVGDGLFGYAIGAYNGFERHTNFFEGYAQGVSLSGNRFSRLAFVSRVWSEPLGSLGNSMADLTGGSLRLGVGAAGFYNAGGTTTTFGWEVDAHLKVAGFHLVAEIVKDEASPVVAPTTPLTIPAEVGRMSVAAEAGYMILPAQLGLTLRGELVDDNDRDENNGDVIVLGGGLQYYWKAHHLRAGLDFTHREELNGQALDNDSLILQLQFER